MFSRCEISNPGTVLLSNSPVAWILRQPYWGQRCCACMRLVPNSTCTLMLRCSKCKKATYCSTSCQKHDWKQHKAECYVLDSLTQILTGQQSDGILLLLRLFAVKDGLPTNCTLKHSNIVHCGAYHSRNLSSSDSKAAPKITDNYIQIGAIVCRQPDSLIRKTLLSFECNNFEITDGTMNPCIGSGIYPRAALLNHSCAPNCLPRFNFGIGYAPVIKVRIIVSNHKLHSILITVEYRW